MNNIKNSYFNNPEQHIPKGIYCYGANGTCPFWSVDENKPKQENGYCHYMKKGDWDINAEGGVILDCATNEAIHLNYYPFGGLLWDMVKECGINDDIDEAEWT